MSIMKRIIENTLRSLDGERLKSKSATVGFDGCADSILKVIKKRGSDGVEYFNTMSEFAAFVSDKNGVSCSIELDEVMSKPGGNCAIFAESISMLGVCTSAVGLFGAGRINDEFLKLSELCELYSYGNNPFALALEFDNGKVILSPGVKLNADAWSSIQAAVRNENMHRVFARAEILALLNWSELEFSTRIWSGLLELLKNFPDHEKQIIIDLADCSRNSKAEIDELLLIIDGLSKLRSVILSFNENEALVMAKHFGLPQTDYNTMGESLYNEIKVQTIVIHSAKACYTFEAGKVFTAPTQFNPEPKLLTGAGDNFNSGYAAGRLLGLNADQCNVLGNSVSSYYVKHCASPSLPQLMQHIKLWYESLRN